MILAGRGWGKTRTGAEDIVAYGLRHPETQLAVVAPTSGDLRRVCFGGPSGLLSILPEECMWKGSRRKAYASGTSELRLYNGSLIMGFPAIEPDRLRGPQFHRAWCDELAAWRYDDAWDQLQFGLRLGHDPKAIVTTTPKPRPLVVKLVDHAETITTTGSTFENEANLAPRALARLRDEYEGTRLGRQELHAELLTDVEGALWTRDLIEKNRVTEYPEIVRVVVACDPAVSSDAKTSAANGIIIAGLGANGHVYVFEDLTDVLTPNETSKRLVDAYHLWEADRVVAEVNNGGDWIEMGLRSVDRNVSYKTLHASKGKYARAEPVSALYEQNRVHHVGYYGLLESELCTWVPDGDAPSPNRLDALVWAVTELCFDKSGVRKLKVKI